MSYKEIKGDLIELAVNGRMFDVIAHGVNCFCVQGAGLAPKMVKAFQTNTFPMEAPLLKGDIGKLGNIEYKHFDLKEGKAIPIEIFTYQNEYDLTVVNAYTQYNYGSNHSDGDKKPIDYNALALCLKKINHIFRGRRVGLPLIGGGLAGGDAEIIKRLIKKIMKNCDTTLVLFEQK